MTAIVILSDLALAVVIDLSHTSHILGIMGWFKGTACDNGGYVAVSVRLPGNAHGTSLDDARRVVLDAGRAAGYLHTAHVLSTRGVMMATHEGKFTGIFDVGVPRWATVDYWANGSPIVFIVTCVTCCEDLDVVSSVDYDMLSSCISPSVGE